MRNKLQQFASLDEAVDAYEASLAAGADCELTEFLPHSSHPDFVPILMELIRVDLEHSWARGECRRTEDYCLDFPEVLSDSERRAEVAYEEYRVRIHAGRPLAAEDFEKRLAISTKHWPGMLPAESSRRSPDQSGPSADDSLARLQINEAFPQFRVVEELGRGTFGRVYLAKQRDLADRFVAIKVTADTTQEPERIAGLQHTAIVPVYSVHRTESWQAMCMPYFGRTTLSTLLETLSRRGCFPVSGQEVMRWVSDHDGAESRNRPAPAFGFAHPDVADSYVRACCLVIAEVAAALHFAHQQGILHCDIKPANILIADDGRPMLLDFNLSSQTSSRTSGKLAVGGTLPYLPPEQLAAFPNSASLTAAADIYSLGIVLYQLLTIRLPFPIPREKDKPALVRALLQQRLKRAPNASAINPNVSPGLAAIVDKCLAPDPNDRYQAAGDLQEDLERHLKHRPLRFAPNCSIHESLFKWRRRHPRLLSLTSLGLAMCLLLSLGAFGWTARENHVRAMQVELAWTEFQAAAADARVLLSAPTTDPEVLQEAVDSAQHAIRLFTEHAAEALQETPAPPGMTSTRRTEWCRSAGELYYLLASAQMTQSRSIQNKEQKIELLKQARRSHENACRWLPRAGNLRAIALQRQMIDSDEVDTPDQNRDIDALRLPPNMIDAWILAAHHVATGRASEAMPLLDRLAEVRAEDYSIWFLRATALARTNRFEAAEQCFGYCLALQSSCWVAWLERGIVRSQSGRYASAESDFNEVIQRRPDLAAGYVNRALVRMANGHYPQALADLNAALDRNGPARCWFLRSECHRRMHNLQAAESDFKQGLNTQPSDSISWVARGVAWLKQDPAKALADFENALAVDPLSVDAAMNIAHVYAEIRKEPKPAIDALNRILTSHPQHVAALASRAVLYARLHRTHEAVADAETVLSLQPKPLHVYQAACVYALLPETEISLRQTAIELLRDALARDVSLAELLISDPDLDSLRDMQEFRELLAASTALSMPQFRNRDQEVNE